jgi:phenylalanyl-tRNA synthetase alpha subunit
LKRAEERRLSLEQLRATLLAAENSRPIEVSKIKDQQAEGIKIVFVFLFLIKFLIKEFKKQTEEKLQKKLESAKENRERVLQAKIEKAKAPIEKGLAIVQQNLAKLEEERQLLQEKINQKLNTAETSKNNKIYFLLVFFSLRSARTIRSFNGKT